MAEAGKTQNIQQEPPKKNYSFSIFLFLLGIVAVSVLTVYTYLRKLPKIFTISELVVLTSLIGLLVASISAKKRMVRQYALNERYPYANVEKKEIEAIFDKIAEVEKKRKRLDDFASGVDLSKMPTITAPAPKAEETEEKSADDSKAASAPAAEKSGGGEDSGDESDIISVFPDDEESSDEKSGSSDKEKDDKKDADRASESKAGDAEKGEKKAPAKQRPEDQSGRPRKKRPPEGERQRTRQGRPRPYDPYYDDYYYDSQGRRRRAPVYYDEYGNPIRPRVVYDEYGNPIRRRPADPRRAPQNKSRRPADAAGAARRPAAHSNAAGSTGKKKRPSSPSTAAPVEMTPIKQHSNYGDDYVPVAIVDEEDNYVPTPAPASRQSGTSKKRRPTNAREAAERKPYVPKFSEGEVIVTIPDYDDYDDDGEEYIPPAPRAAREDVESGKKRKRPPERYVPDYSDEEVIVSVPDYDDEEEAAASARQYRRQTAATDNGYDEEDESAPIVLPRDEGFDEYIEQKQAEERRATRKANGKTALTIRKLRSKKIRRKSRKYRAFRVSLHSLTEYLTSFSMRYRH